MDVLISGSSGLIGNALRQALQDAGHRPIRLVRAESPKEGDAVRWDPTGGRIEAAALEGIGAAVHLAGEPLFGRWTTAKKRRISASRVLGTRLLAESLAGLERRPSVLLSGSAVGVYGSRGDEVLTEASEPGDGFLADVCQEWEAAAAPAAEAGIRVVHLRTGLVQSRDALLVRLQLPFFLIGLGGKIGSGQQWFPWISLEDHVRAMLHLLHREDAAGPVNLTAPNPARNADYARTLGQVLKRPVFLTVPRFGVAAVFGRQAADELAAASQRAVPARLTDELGFDFRHPHLEEALRAMFGAR
ncbi:MAG: TIGR01777 family oxidoreductase [Nitriliruptorales bacterium]